MRHLGIIKKIEYALFQMSKKDLKLQEYFFTYYSQRLILINHFYPHIESELKGYVDHGPEHIFRLIDLLGKILKNNIVGLEEEEEVIGVKALNFYEIYILLCGAIWHDAGNLLGREGHAKKVGEIDKRLKGNFFVDKEIKEYSLQIAKSHSGEDAVRKEIHSDSENYNNFQIDLRFLGALLRFADELEEGMVRIDSKYYECMNDKILEENKIYWESGMCIKQILPEPNNLIIKIFATINKNDLFKLFKKEGKEVTLVDELINKIDKMNNERKYYMLFVRKHLDFNEIEFNLRVKSEDQSPENYTFKFNNDDGYFEFWNNNSNINPQKHGHKLQKGNKK